MQESPSGDNADVTSTTEGAPHVPGTDPSRNPRVGSGETVAHEDRLYRAMEEHDGRFDGLFFSGIVTTGVYCRAVCPVPKIARRENVRFYTSVAAAEGAGFRPCLRCHPERSAGTPIWGTLPPTLARALELIMNGALDAGRVEEVASRVGVGERQLRRLFDEHFGASPLAVAKARRVHFARSLLEETPLPVSDVAFVSGFQSVRQFNHDFRRTFGRKPTDVRRRHPHVTSDGSISLSLPYRPPLDWPRTIAFLQPQAVAGVEIVAHDRYQRTIEINGEAGELEVRIVPDRPVLALRVRSNSAAPIRTIVSRARRLFDLDADPLRIGQDLAASPVLAPLLKARPGLRVPGAWDPFELTVRAVLGEDRAPRTTATLTRRVVESFGRPLDTSLQGLTHLFPTPELLARADLVQAGATVKQQRAINSVATVLAAGDFAFDASRGLEDFLDRFRRATGVSEWVAHYVALRGMGEPDAFPAEDIELRRRIGSPGRPLSPHALVEVAEQWRPWRGYAAMYLWAIPSTNNARAATRP